MDTIFLNKDVRFRNPIYFGNDSFIYRYDNDTLFKQFRNTGESKEEWADLLTNKGQKITKMSEFDMPENYFKALVFQNGQLIGYTMENIFKAGYKPVSKLNYKTREKRLELLEEEKKVFQGLNRIGITYGDIDSSNILYNPSNHRIILLNIDNVRLRDNDFDSKNMYMSHYLKKNPKHPELLDNFMFNVHTIVYLQNVFYPSVFQVLNEGKFCFELDTPANMRIAKEMVDLDENYHGKLFVDNQKVLVRKKPR
jgi:hypothetical protein